MERSEILSAMSTLKLYGMKAVYDDILATAIKRQHEPQQIIGDLLNAEISEKQARSIKYQMTIAKMPMAKDAGTYGKVTRGSVAAGGVLDLTAVDLEVSFSQVVGGFHHLQSANAVVGCKMLPKGHCLRIIFVPANPSNLC